MTQNLIDQMRPQDEHQYILDLRKKSGESFYQKYHTEFIDIVCPACGEESESVFQRYFFNHKKCKKCNTLFCSPRPPENLLFEYYEKYEAPNAWTTMLLKTDAVRKAMQYQPRVELLINVIKQNYINPLSSAFDIGAGSGAFTLALQNANYFSEVLAVDITDSCIEACQKIGLKTIKSSIQDLPDTSTDYIGLNDLFEHLYNPKEFLQECLRVLRPNGVISIASPNGEGFDFKLFKENTVNITPPEHLNYFNPHSIELLLRNNGFEILYLETPGRLDVQIVCRETLKGYDLKKENEYLYHLFFEKDEQMQDKFQDFLAQNCLSSHLLVIAKKI